MRAPEECPQLYEALFAGLTAGGISDDDLLKLHHAFGAALVPALHLVDRGEVTRITLPSKRAIYQVSSSSGAPYTVYPAPILDIWTGPGRPYCPCEAFGYMAVTQKSGMFCKHLLALTIALRTDRIRRTEIGEEGLPALLGLMGMG